MKMTQPCGTEESERPVSGLNANCKTQRIAAAALALAAEVM